MRIKKEEPCRGGEEREEVVVHVGRADGNVNGLIDLSINEMRRRAGAAAAAHGGTRHLQMLTRAGNGLRGRG